MLSLIDPPLPCPDAARCDGPLISGAVPRLLFSEPLPLAIGRPLTSSATTLLDSFLAKVLKLMSFRLALLADRSVP